ncbi:MAG TPA: hypothetical protein VLJ61_00080 [Pyrinomonadaceae bacterium]|nr:hypothetical protein [Pyrinomonadaceae bacterium]
MAETFDWLKPSILWQRDGADMLQKDFFRPTLHGFKSDKFMDEFLANASAPGPKQFRSSLARVSQFDPFPRPSKTSVPLKLFQPVHGCFYLASASLCCRIPGFPDREVNLGEGESVFFVLRKKVGGVEYEWKTKEAGKGWGALNGKASSVSKDEERLPLFQTLTAKGRTIFFGYIPVSSQDTFAAAPADSPVETDDARMDELDALFIFPLSDPNANPADPPDPDFNKVFAVGIAGAQTPSLRISVYLLLDLLEYLDKYLPVVGKALEDDTTSSLAGEEKDLTDFLHQTQLGSTLRLDAALRQVATKQADLNEPGDGDLAALGFSDDYDLSKHKLSQTTLDNLRTKVSGALKSPDATTVAPAPVVVPKVAPEAGDKYVLRCVYERAQCVPAHQYVSRPSEEFELAPFFDPDAPARDIRVGLPVDVSIAGLRKFKKNVAFMMSKELRNKLGAVSGKEKDILDGKSPGPEDSFSLGHICSFSIPIITICAFILLLIIVILLNLVFWWIPLLKICFPLKLSAKS